MLRSLVYFDDADAEPDPKMLIDLGWPEVKCFFETEVKGLINKDAS